MLIVVSPAKSLDYQSPLPTRKFTQPAFLDQSEALIGILREKSPAEIAQLMTISDALATLNFTRYAEWSRPFTAKNARPAMFAFDGDVYGGLDAYSFTPAQIDFAQTHFRMLSGLYGVLRPLDLMQAYRLEMGTKLANPAGRDLYAFWGDTITLALNAELAQQDGEPVLLNLASEEYFKSVRPKKLAARVITPVFEEKKGAGYKIVSFHAKRARGLMSRYAIVNAITDPEALKAFDAEGYAFSPAASDGERWVFRREAA
ncbi:peroxide stress protein YaaA [Uliginosibacterium sp. 31-16]|uniref:peroxide stress protein YaaA n=1 Tax=Uliginosibacterium sp. 31-16 TaxID=3068315 RepID=UPI00273E322D|nr:peroxide stress protein YaaA [Uliginosibacterium sp. 31-16]MDP5240561.1 peroxide stress protein YaaA [Uliginosibacterium sp. 31-16]